MKKLSPGWLFQFQQLIEIGSFTETALKLNLSQQSLSRNMHELEAWAGQSLLTRLPGRLELTPGGQLLWQRLPELLQSLQLAVRPARDSPHLGIAPFWNECFLPDCLLSLLDAQPGLDLQVLPLNEPDILAFLLAGELDLGLMLNPPGQGFSRRALPRLDWVLVATPALAEAASLPYLSCASPDLPDPLAGLSWERPAHCVGRVNSQALLRECVCQGFGAGLLLAPTVSAELAAGSLCRLPLPALPAVQPYAVWLGPEPPPELAPLLHLLDEAMRA